MEILRTGTARLLSAGDRIGGGIWIWILSIAFLIPGLFGISFLTAVVAHLIVGEGFSEAARLAEGGAVRGFALTYTSMGLASISSTLPVILIALKILGLSTREIIAPMAKVSVKLVAIVAAICFVLLSVTTFAYIGSNDVASFVALDLLPANYLHFVPLILIIVVFQASAEELLFRGYFLQLVGRITKRWWIILPIVAGSFAAIHFANPEIDAFGWFAYFDYVLGGLLFTSVALMTGRLEYSIGMHIGWNWTLLLTDIDSASMPDLYTGFGALIYTGDLTPTLSDALATFLLHFVLFLICLDIHFRHVEPRRA